MVYLHKEMTVLTMIIVIKSWTRELKMGADILKTTWRFIPSVCIATQDYACLSRSVYFEHGSRFGLCGQKVTQLSTTKS